MKTHTVHTNESFSSLPPSTPQGSRAMKGRSLLCNAQLTRDQFATLLSQARTIKRTPKATKKLYGKTIVLFFEQPSTRTRFAFHSALGADGAQVITADQSSLHINTKENFEDSVRAIATYVDAIVYRGAAHEVVERMTVHSTVPVINALTTQFHPTQALADMLTIQECCGTLRDVNLTYIGDCSNNIARSLAIASVLCDVRLTLAAPADYQIDRHTLELCEALALNHKRLPVQTDNPIAAVSTADVVYTDVWSSMGTDARTVPALKQFEPFALTTKLLSFAPADAIVMHCLPANRGQEITTEVLDSDRSVVWQQAENKMHTIRALMRSVL